MQNDDFRNTGSLLGDLWRELSWPLRLGFFGGMLAGLGLGIYLVTQGASEAWRTGWLRILLLFILGLTALGGIVGLAVGVAIDLGIKALTGTKEDKPRGRKKRRGER